MIPLVLSGPLPAQSASDLQLKLADSEGSSVKAGSRSAKGFTIQVTDGSGAPVSDAAVVLHLPESGPSGTFGDGSRASVAYSDQSGLAHFSGIQWNDTAGSFSVRVTATKGTAHAGMLLEASLVSGTPAMLPVQASESAGVSADKPAVPTTNKPEAKPMPAAQTLAVQQPGTLDPVDRLPPPAHIVGTAAPSVSVTNGPTHEKIHSGSGKMKWILIAAIAAGAGVGVAMAGKGKSSSSSSTSTSTSPTVGSPTISVGQQ